MRAAKLVFSVIFLTVCQRLPAQVAPAATASHASLAYTLRYSQSAQFGESNGDWQTINTGGNLDYSNGNGRHPFTVSYGGGYNFIVTGPPYGKGLSQNLQLSQGAVWGKSHLLISDGVSYRQSTGFLNNGEQIGVLLPNPQTDQTILTLNAPIVGNTLAGDFSYTLNFATSLSAGVTSDLFRYPNGNGIDTNSLLANTGMNFRINARSSLFTQYMFSKFGYPDSGYAFSSNTLMFGFQRAWSRSLTSNISVGPQFIGGSQSMPASTGISVQASASYQFHTESAGASYQRGVSGGSGFLQGEKSDSLTATFNRDFQKIITLGLTGGYRNSSALGGYTGISGKFGGVQFSTQPRRHLSLSANYTATSQSVTGVQLPGNVLGTLLQGVSFGMEYSREMTPNR